MIRRPSAPLFRSGAAVRSVCAAAALLALTACGGGSSNGSSYTISGTITGLTTSSVVLTNGGSTVTVPANSTTWAFTNAFNAGSSYAVTVLTQPVGELCEVTSGGSGTSLTGNVSNVTVACSTFGQWIWQSGANSVDASGVYGTLQVASASNVPGARYGASSWTDPSGNFWLFGGVGYDASGKSGYLNDLWEYSPTTGLWTWVGGAAAVNAAAVYGTAGTAAAGNLPGPRQGASSWIDAAGNLWLFGGYGYDSTSAVGRLSDLWKYTPGSGQWTWVGGSNARDATGVYGTQGTAAAANAPGARYAADAWIDTAGNVWLFGGYGYDSAGAVGNLNDLWKYTPASGQWTWVGGANVRNAIGLYGAHGAASATNVPGARQAASSWTDTSGNLWLLGGYGYDASGVVGYLNDLWLYVPGSGQWTWVGGASAANASGAYGTQGTAAAGNVPGGRYAASSWIDASGNLWLSSGYGYDAVGGLGALNDLWKYSPSTGQWNWVSGGSGADSSGAYGTLGTVAASAGPGGRQAANAWIDSTGHLWLFGGAGNGQTGNGYLNDLWQFLPP